MKRRTQAALVALGVVLAVAAPAIAATVLSGGKSAGENVVWNKSDGPRVVAGEEFNFTTENPWATSGQITLDPYVTVSGPAGSQARLDVINGTWTNMSSIDTDGGTLAVTVNDKQDVSLEGGVTDFDYRDVALDDGTADFVYAGPDGGTTTVTLADVPGSTTIAAVDAGGDVLDVSSSGAGGSVTFELPQSEHTVRLQTTDGGPTIDDSSLSPNSSDSVGDPSAVTLQADVDDPDFPDDEVTVEFYVDGSKVGEDTLQSAGTASYTYESTVAGEHEWYAVATDAYGQSDTSATAVFGSPSELRIYNESAPTQLVDNATVELRYYFSEESTSEALVVSRNTTDGVINMTGLPGDQPFVVVADAEGYLPRRIYVPSLFETQRVYLLPEDEQSVSVRFDLQDYSGEYPADSTVLLIQRALNGSWQTVHGDRFGATGEFPAQLRYNTRHRLLLLNTNTGEERVVGPFTPLTDSTQTVTVRTDTDPTLESGVRVTAGPSLRQLANETTSELTVTIGSDQADLTAWNITVLYGSAGQVPSDQLAQSTGTDPNGTTYSPELDLAGRAGGTVLVKVTYTTDEGVTDTQTSQFRVVKTWNNEFGLLPTLQTMVDNLPSGTSNMVTTLLTIVVTLGVMGATGSSATASTEVVGLVGVLTLGAFGIIGWVGYDIVFAAGAAWATMSALRRVV